MAQERLDKILCGTGLYSRSEAKALITGGLVTVSGAVVRKGETKITRDQPVTVRGQGIDTAEFVYYMMNKPVDYVSATRDEHCYPAVTGLLPKHLQNRGLFPVGRLDVDVTGLLILTDDGAYAHRVTAPKSAISKVYEIHTDGVLTEADKKMLAQGVRMDNGTVYRPALLDIDPADPTSGRVTVTEGKFHEVKNLLRVCGHQIVTMRRLAIGGLWLDESLPVGGYRSMTQEETQACFR
jgi:16S rRNA pseudouridine516 synthase